ncbi:MAG TPA: hypothetical protein VG013_08390 [Gemmataceae bacterium]|nr:hypothetical protein [Gemmataceae bacterium]
MGVLDRFFGPPSKDKFARLMMEAIRQAGETNALRYDPADFCVYREGEAKGVLNLDNAYREYCAAPTGRRPAVVKSFVRTWFTYRKEIPTDFEDARHDLLPGIRNRAFYEIAKLTLPPEVNWPYRVLADSLGVGLVYDLPESMMQVQQHHLDGWRVTFDEAFEAALRNLPGITPHGMAAVGPGLWVSPWKDNYDPSRLLLPDFIRQHEVSGDPVVMVPNRDTLLLTSSDDAEGLARLAALAEEAYAQPRSISGVALRLTAEDEWQPFLPGEAHQKFRTLRLRSTGDDYAAQADDLKALHEKTGKDIFVATFSALQKKETHEVRSYCVWSEGVVALLPRTDDIFFFRPRGREEGDIVATAPWERVQSALADLMKPAGLYPERYLVEDFPSEEQLAALDPVGS